MTPTTLYGQTLFSTLEQSLNGQVRVMPETDKPLTITDVLEKQSEFVLYLDDNPNYGFRDKGLWLQLRLNNRTDNDRWAVTLGFAQLDYVDFYLVSHKQVIAQSAQGKRLGGQQFRLPTFLVQLPPDVDFSIYVRVQSQSSALILPMSITTETSLLTSLQLDSLVWGLFYGGLAILALYSAVSFFASRELSLITYVIYIIAVIFWQMVWGGHIYWLDLYLSHWVVNHTQLIFSLVGLASGLFTLTFLSTKQNARLAHPLILAMMCLQLLMAFASVLIPLPHDVKNTAVYALGLIAICTYVMAGFEAFYNRFHPAKYFIVAWSLLATGAIIGMLSLLGVVPSNTFTTYCFQVGVFLEAGLFSIALLGKQRSLLQAEIAQATDDLRNNIEYIEEQNVRLDIARKEAIKASSVKSQFLANMSHEIRTPLNAIVGFSRELSLSNISEPQAEHVRIIHSAADTLLNIVNDVLDFSKIEAGKLHLNNQPYSVTQLLEDVVAVMAKSAHNKRLDFIFTMTPLPEKIIGDLFRLRQVLNNLLGNALKFTSTGTIGLSVTSTSLPHGMLELCLKIKDTGIGISRDDQQKLFSAFSQVDDSLNRQYQGTGLGLVISREIVRLMGGSMDLVSQPGLGSTFVVTIRCNVLSYKQSLCPSSAWIGKRVIVFDPHPESRQASAYMLTTLGARVTSVESIEYLASLDVQVDYVFCSLPMSKMSQRPLYIAAASKVRAKRRVLVYAGQPPSLFDEILAQQFEQHIRLPLTPVKLQAIVSPTETLPLSLDKTKAPDLPNIRVLAVDDMEMNLKLIRTWLHHSNVQLSICMSGEDAVRHCQEQEFELILMDIQMPGMDGITATQHIRKTVLNMGTPIVAVTAHVFKEEKDRLLSSGLDDYLPKPVNFDDLCHLIKRWCSTPADPPLKSVDWPLALKRSNGDANLAKEIFHDFLLHLPVSLASLQDAWTHQHWDQMCAEAHRLHGASAYTGAPKLQKLVADIETKLKRNEREGLEVIMERLVEESDILIHYPLSASETAAR